MVVKWIMRYLNGTLNCGWVYERNTCKGDGFWGYVDSDYARDLDRIRSLTGYVFMLNGCLINWKVTLHYVVALSTTKVEYTTATEVVKKASWLKGLVSELGKMQRSVPVFCDSSSAIHLSNNPTHHEKTKHIDIKIHFIRYEVSKRAIKLVKIHTGQNLQICLLKLFQQPSSSYA